jgi:hypothetical protein
MLTHDSHWGFDLGPERLGSGLARRSRLSIMRL